MSPQGPARRSLRRSRSRAPVGDDGRGIDDREASLDSARGARRRTPLPAASLGTWISTSSLARLEGRDHHVDEEVARLHRPLAAVLASFTDRARSDHHGQVVGGRVGVRDAAADRAAVSNLDVGDERGRFAQERARAGG